jgi:hypothetical protein
MFPLTRILSFTAACALVALTAASIPARAEDSAPDQRPIDSRASILTDQDAQQQIGECHLLRRAISRRACVAGLWREENMDTAENQ